MTFRDHPRS